MVCRITGIYIGRESALYEELIRYRLNMAYEKAASAKLLLDHGQYKDSVSRSYYAIFSALRALLAT